MRLKAGQIAPNIDVNDYNGQAINTTQLKGSPLMVSFFRYAACPFCNLRVHKMIKNYPQFHDKGLQIICIFQSPASSIKKYVGKQEAAFSIIGDPEMKLYKKYRLKCSWIGLLISSMNPMNTVNSMQKGLFNIHPEGPTNRLPADFLIDGNGVIQQAYYGKTAADHIPFKTINTWLEKSNNES